MWAVGVTPAAVPPGKGPGPQEAGAYDQSERVPKICLPPGFDSASRQSLYRQRFPSPHFKVSGAYIYHRALKCYEVLRLCGDRVEWVSNFVTSVLFNLKRNLA